jgi:hypothetical protein
MATDMEKILLALETMSKRLDKFESILKSDDSPDVRASTRHNESFRGGGAASSGKRLSSVMFSPSALTEVMDNDGEQKPLPHSLSDLAREPTVRLSQPILKVQDEYTYDDILNFLDIVKHYIEMWEAQPVNRKRQIPFPDSATFAITLFPPKAAEYVCDMIGWIYSPAHCRTKSKSKIQTAQWWKDIDGDILRAEIIQTRTEDKSYSANLTRLRKIKYPSATPYDLVHFRKFCHDLNREIRHSEEGDFKFQDVDIKDHVISAFPDKKYQKELYARYGNVGISKSNFDIGEVLEEIERKIKRLVKDNIDEDVNRSAQYRDGKELKVHEVTMHNDDAEPEPEFDLQETVNQAMVGTEKCRKVGVGPDGKLLCRWLGGDRATCTFQHPPSDILLKGKGVSNESRPRTPAFKPHSGFRAQKAVTAATAEISSEQPLVETNAFLEDIDE